MQYQLEVGTNSPVKLYELPTACVFQILWEKFARSTRNLMLCTLHSDYNSSFQCNPTLSYTPQLGQDWRPLFKIPAVHTHTEVHHEINDYYYLQNVLSTHDIVLLHYFKNMITEKLENNQVSNQKLTTIR